MTVEHFELADGNPGAVIVSDTYCAGKWGGYGRAVVAELESADSSPKMASSRARGVARILAESPILYAGQRSMRSSLQRWIDEAYLDHANARLR